MRVRSDRREIFRVCKPCLDLGLRAGAVVFDDLRISRSPPELRRLIDAHIEALSSRLPDIDAVCALEDLAAYRRVLQQVGSDPRRLSGSVESLHRYALRRRTLPAINNLVDAYNLVSLRTRCSLGAHDLDAIAVPVQLAVLAAATDFTPLGHDGKRRVEAGEFAYVDASGRILCRLDVLQADFSKVTENTRRALLIIEATTAHDPQQVQAAFDQAAALIPRFCCGRVERVVGWEAWG